MNEASEQRLRDARAREAFLKSIGVDGTEVIALPGDASTRRYFRLPGKGALILQDDPSTDHFQNFALISRHLTSLGFSAPRILDWDEDLGLGLIEDFGDRTYTRLLACGADEAPLYELAVDTLSALHEAPGAADINLPGYDHARLTDEVALLPIWFARHASDKDDLSAFAEQHQTLWSVALKDVASRREVLVLRDFHVDNLILLEKRPGVAACGLLDFQGGLIGSAAYDLMSVLQDARRDLDTELTARLVKRYLRQRHGMDEARFLSDFHALAAQRHAKILGIFVRLANRDGKRQYLEHLPRVARLYAAALEAAGLTEVRALMDQHLPGWSDPSQWTA
ncbi:MAG: phosphotransferase [Paracoccaceae bacterium]|nr:phosphotransferase [Paracoccaceae bacterium]